MQVINWACGLVSEQIQTIPMVYSDRYGLEDEGLAITCSLRAHRSKLIERVSVAKGGKEQNCKKRLFKKCMGCDWLRFKYVYNLAGLCVATLVFACGLFVSAKNTQILTHQHCPSPPDVYFTSNHKSLHQKVAEAVRNAKKFVQFSMYDVYESLFVSEYLEACKTAT